MDFMLQKLVRFGKKRKANLPLTLLCIFFQYAVLALGDYAERLGKALWGKPTRRLTAATLSLCLVVNLLPMTAFAAETNTPPGISGECGHVHDKDCGYIEAVEGAPCSHQNGDGSYSCAPILDSDVSGNATPSDADESYVCDHNEGCGYVEAVDGADCTHSCELCDPPVKTPPVENPPDKDDIVTDTCVCDTLCTEGVINPDCPVCSAQDADLTLCVGAEEEKATTYEEVVALFEALPNVDSITEETTDEEKEEITAQINAALDALDALSGEDFIKFKQEYSDLLAAVAALQAALINDIPTPIPENTTTPTVNGTSIYANGLDLRLSAGTDSNTIVEYRAMGSANDSDYTAFAVTGDTASNDGYDLSNYTIFGGGNTADVNGDTKITMTGGAVKAIYGGGRIKNVTGSTSVTIGDGASVSGNVYGGGNVGAVGTADDNSTAEVNIESGATVGQSVYGGGNSGKINGSTQITVNGTVTYSVYGGGYASSPVSGNTTVIVGSTGKINSTSSGIYGGGVGSGDTVGGDTSITIRGTVASNVCGGGSAGKVEKNTHISIDGGTVGGNVYGGGGDTTAVVGGSTVVNIAGTVKKNVYGGGSNSSVGTAGESNTATVTVAAAGVVTGSVYGGGRSAVIGDAAVTIYGTVGGSIYGGGDGSFASITGTSAVTVGGGAKVGDTDNNGIIINGGTTAAVANGVDSFKIYPTLSGANKSVYVNLPAGYDVSSNRVIATDAVTGDAAKIALTGAGAGGMEAFFDSTDNTIKVRTAAATAVELWRNNAKVSNHATLADAITAAQTGDKLVITADIGLDGVGVTINGKSLTLDLNGKTITYTGTGTGDLITLENSGGLTVTGSGGKLETTSSMGCAISNLSTGTVTITGGTVSATGSTGYAIYNSSTGTVMVTGGAVSAAGSVGYAISNSSTGTVTITGGTVSATGTSGRAIDNRSTGKITISGNAAVSATGRSGYAIYNRSTGKITVSSSAVVTSANTITDIGTIYLRNVPADGDLVVLHIQDTAQVTNTANPAGYAAYFTPTSVTPYNVKAYYKVAEGATLGKVHPDPSTGPTPTVSANNIFANGLDLKLEAGNTADKTKVSYRTIGREDLYTDFAVTGAAGDTVGGYDLSDYNVYGGSEEAEVIGDTSVIMTGGEVLAVYGGGFGGSVTGTATVKIAGGTVNTLIGESSNRGTVGSINVTMTGGTADYVSGGTGRNAAGMADVTITGGTVNKNVFGTGCSVTVGGGAKIGGNNFGIIINGGTPTPIIDGVDSLKIAPDLTGVDGSVSIFLPTGYTVGTIATSAVEGDLAKIALTGPGAENKTMEFNGTDKTIVVKVAGTTTTTVTSVTVSPASAAVQKGNTRQFTAMVRGTNNPAQTVSWAVTGGKTGTGISNAGLLTVASDETAAALTVTATSTADTTKSGTATVTVQADALTDAQKLAMAKSAIEAALADLTVSNATTAQNILSAANAATLYNVTVAWDGTGGFGKTEATAEAEGSITGKLQLTLGSASDTVTVNKVIAKLSADKSPLTAAIAAADSAKSGVIVSDLSPSSVASGTKFVNTAEMEALNHAIAAAQAVLDSPSATDAEITAAVNALNSALAVFNSAIKTGTYTGGSSSSGSGGSSGGSSGGGSTVTTPTEAKPSAPTESEIKVDGTVDANGNMTVTLPENTVDEAIKKAEDEARRNGNLNNGVTLVLNVQGGSGSPGSVTVNLPKTTQETIISKQIVNTVIVVNNPDIKIGMDLSAVKSINTQANADVNITATKLNGAGLAEAAKAAIGSRPVFDLKVNYGGGKQVTNFDGGSVSVAIPYTLGADEKVGGIYAVYVDGGGNVQWLTGSVYDAENRVLRFRTSHFSAYGVGYQAPAEFTDIEGHWAKDDIQFVVNRGLVSGTSAAAFSPNTAMTRGMLVTALGRLAGADVSGCKQSSFTDVKQDAYYMGYVEWAAQNGIMNGTTATTFAPDNAVTREQMAVIMENYAKAVGLSLPKAHAQNTFADAANISSWAKDSVKTMQMAGVLAGKNANRFEPQGTATRAEAAATLRRFMGLMIDASTVQGWMRNDDGQWMYYENGSPVKNTTKNVGGEDYSFDTYGVTLDFPKKKIGIPQ